MDICEKDKETGTSDCDKIVENTNEKGAKCDSRKQDFASLKNASGTKIANFCTELVKDILDPSNNDLGSQTNLKSSDNNIDKCVNKSDNVAGQSRESNYGGCSKKKEIIVVDKEVKFDKELMVNIFRMDMDAINVKTEVEASSIDSKSDTAVVDKSVGEKSAQSKCDLNIKINSKTESIFDDPPKDKFSVTAIQNKIEVSESLVESTSRDENAELNSIVTELEEKSNNEPSSSKQDEKKTPIKKSKSGKNEDVPEDFFDDFLNHEFMDGLDIVDDDEWEDTVNNEVPKSDEEAEPRTVEPKIVILKSHKPERTQPKKRIELGGDPVLKCERRDPEKTKRDIQMNKAKCAKAKERKLLQERLDSGLVPPGMEMEEEEIEENEEEEAEFHDLRDVLNKKGIKKSPIREPGEAIVEKFRGRLEKRRRERSFSPREKHAKISPPHRRKHEGERVSPPRIRKFPELLKPSLRRRSPITFDSNGKIRSESKKIFNEEFDIKRISPTELRHKSPRDLRKCSPLRKPSPTAIKQRLSSEIHKLEQTLMEIKKRNQQADELPPGVSPPHKLSPDKEDASKIKSTAIDPSKFKNKTSPPKRISPSTPFDSKNSPPRIRGSREIELRRQSPESRKRSLEPRASRRRSLEVRESRRHSPGIRESRRRSPLIRESRRRSPPIRESRRRSPLDRRRSPSRRSPSRRSPSRRSPRRRSRSRDRRREFSYSPDRRRNRSRSPRRKEKTFLEELAEKLNKPRSSQTPLEIRLGLPPPPPPHQNQFHNNFASGSIPLSSPVGLPNINLPHMNLQPPMNLPLPMNLPSPINIAPSGQNRFPLPSGHNMFQPPLPPPGPSVDFDQQFFIGPQPVPPPPGGAQTIRSESISNQIPLNFSSIPSLPNNPPAGPSAPSKEEKEKSQKVDNTTIIKELYEDKKITLSDFLSISAKKEAGLFDIKEKIKVISRCQGAIKFMENEKKIIGKLCAPPCDEAVANKPKYATSPLLRNPVINLPFTSTPKTFDQKKMFNTYMDKVLISAGIHNVIEIDDEDDDEDTYLAPPPPIISGTSASSSKHMPPPKEKSITATGRNINNPNEYRSIVKSDGRVKIPENRLMKMTQTDLARCYECESRKKKRFSQAGTQCGESVRFNIATQYSEEDFAPKKPFQSLASLTPAQLLGKKNEEEPRTNLNRFLSNRPEPFISPFGGAQRNEMPVAGNAFNSPFMNNAPYIAPFNIPPPNEGTPGLLPLPLRNLQQARTNAFQQQFNPNQNFNNRF